MKFNILILLLIAFYCTSCVHTDSTKPEFDFNTDSMTTEKLKYIMNLKANKIKTLEAEGQIEYETPESGNSGSILLAVNRPDTIYARLRGPFGITGIIMTINRDNFIYYNVQEAIAINGSTTPENISYIMKIELDFNTLINLISGTYNFTENNNTSDYFYKLKSDYYYNSYDSLTARTTRIVIDSNFNITRLSIFDSDGSRLILIEYSYYKYLKGNYFPFEIYFQRTKEREQLWLKYDEIITETGYIKHKIKIPESVRKIYWE
ncbi:MAG: DUF4292 domain-containing protein [Ignavibacteria bacterium]|nr:DUF4292 domain-containing protein [Ignavibacteria bacterium]